MVDDLVDLRGALLGAMIAGLFGAMWTLWGASGLAQPAAAIARIAGIVIGIALVGGSIWAVRRAPAGGGPQGSMFTDPRYLVIVAAEVVAIIAGGLILNATGNAQYVCPWVAVVVGVHYLVFARFFWAGFAILGWAMVAAAVVGAALGLITGERGIVVATTALISAAALFAAGGRTLATASRAGAAARR